MGGSESRFALHQKGRDGDRYVTQQREHQKTGAPAGYGPRNTEDGHQKIVVKNVGVHATLRYDAHPQNYLAIVDGQLVMLSVENVWSHWKILIFAKKVSSENFWSELSATDCNLGYDACKDNSLLVAFYHPESKSFLHFEEESPRSLPVPLTYMDGGNMSSADRASFASSLVTCCWTLECVGTNLSAREGTAAFAIPIVEVGRSSVSVTGVPLPRDQTPFAGYGYYHTFETNPAVVVYAGDKMVKHGKGVAADRLENFCFDAGKCGLLL